MVTILKETPKDPITLMGERAGVCWGADISDRVRNYKRGLDCIRSGHHRVMEYAGVDMILAQRVVHPYRRGAHQTSGQHAVCKL